MDITDSTIRMAAASDCSNISLSDITKCSICLDTWKDPRSPSACDHTFCLQCLKTFVQKLDEDGEDTRCPVCRKKFAIPEGGLDCLPKNFMHQQLLDACRVSEAIVESIGHEPHEEIPVCDLCMFNMTASGYCVECDQNICKICRMSHARARVFINHKVVGLEEKKKPYLIKKLRGSYCQQHRGERVKLYCDDCQKPLCTICYATQHVGHKCTAIDDAAQVFVNRVKECHVSVEGGIAKTEGHLREINKNKNEILEIVSDKEKQFQEKEEKMINLIKSERAQLLNELKHIKEKRLKEINMREKEIKTELIALKGFMKTSKELLDNESPSDICRYTNDLLAQGDVLVKPLTESTLTCNLDKIDIRFIPAMKPDINGCEVRLIGVIHYTGIIDVDEENSSSQNQKAVTLDHVFTCLETQVKVKDSKISSLEKDAKDKDTKISSLEKDVKENGAKISSLEKYAKEKDTQISGLEKDVKEKGTKISSLVTDAKEKNTKLVSLERDVQEKDTKISSLEKSAKEKDTQISGLEKDVKEKDTKVSSLVTDAKEKNTKIASLERDVQEKNTKIFNLEKYAKEKDTKISSLEKYAKEKDNKISSQEKDVKERDTKISSLEKQIKDKDNNISCLDTQLKQVEEKDRKLNEAIDRGCSALFLSQSTVVSVIPGADKDLVRGIAVLGSQLFIARIEAISVEVYDTNNMTITPRLLKISDQTLCYPVLAACSHYNCLYVRHLSGSTEIAMYRVELSDSSVSRWRDANGYHSRGGNLSITNDHTVLATVYDTQLVEEYSTSGSLVRQIRLDSSIDCLSHCIQLSDGNFVVCQERLTQHRVCIVDDSGRIIKSYGGSKGSGVDQLNDPRQLSVDKYDHVFVADSGNSRVQLLSPTLTLLGTVQIPRHQLKYPVTLHFDKINHRLYVSRGSDVLVVELSNTQN